MTMTEARQKKRLTLDDLRSLDADILPPVIVAKFLGVCPYYLNISARDAPDNIPFPFYVSGRKCKHVKFPRQGVIAWAEGAGNYQ